MVYLVGSLVALIIIWGALIWIRDRPSGAMLDQADQAYKAGSFAEAEQLLLQVIARENGPTSLSHRAEYLLEKIVLDFIKQDKLAHAENSALRLLSTMVDRRRLGDWGSSHRELVALTLAGVYQYAGRDGEAENLYANYAVPPTNREDGPTHCVAWLITGLVQFVSDRGQGSQSRLLPPKSKNLDLSDLLNSLVSECAKTGDKVDIERVGKLALSICEKGLGPKHPNLPDAMEALGDSYQALDRYDDSERLYRRALELHEKIVGDPVALLAERHHRFARFLMDRGKLVEAESHCRQALKIREESDARSNISIAVCQQACRSVQNEGPICRGRVALPKNPRVS
jgi:tetratricopeptide (TPR) repeat protein